MKHGYRIWTSLAALPWAVFMMGSDCQSTRSEHDVGDFSKFSIEYRVVSLQSELARRGAIKVQFDAVNAAIEQTNQAKGAVLLQPISFDFIDAILGRELDKDALAREGYYDLGTLRDGELGLFRTTTEKIIPFAASRHEMAIVAVFEDDVVIPIDIELGFRQSLEVVPNDWDILYLGCNRNLSADAGGTVRSPFSAEDAEDPRSYGRLCAPNTVVRIAGTPWVELSSSCTPGTWAYALRTSSAKKLQELVKGLYPINIPIDLAYQRLMSEKKIKAYCLDPELLRPNLALPSSIR